MPLYCFHQCIIDTTRHCLTVRGQLLATPPLIFDLLHFFASHPNRVLSKDELLESVWKTTFVTDSVVARAVMKARRLISGDHSSEGLITTIRGVGYRFDAEVSLVERCLSQSAWRQKSRRSPDGGRNFLRATIACAQACFGGSLS